jgi:DNA-directed RNA polymerase subunit RPC12/RpoP
MKKQHEPVRREHEPSYHEGLDWVVICGKCGVLFSARHQVIIDDSIKCPVCNYRSKIKDI